MAMGNSVHRCGGVGNAQAMKALNNLASASGFLIGIEALLIGQKFGLDPAMMVAESFHQVTALSTDGDNEPELRAEALQHLTTSYAGIWVTP